MDRAEQIAQLRKEIAALEAAEIAERVDKARRREMVSIAAIGEKADHPGFRALVAYHADKKHGREQYSQWAAAYDLDRFAQALNTTAAAILDLYHPAKRARNG